MPNLKIFLKLDGIPGDSTVQGHEREIVVHSFEQGLEVPIIHSAVGGGAHSGRATFSGARFRKDADVASIPMLLACASGQRIREARFMFRRGAPPGEAFYKIVLEDVLLTHIVQRAGTGAQYPLSFDTLNAGVPSDGMLEEATASFARIRWEHRAQVPDGSPGRTTTGGWDVASNQRL